MHKQKEMQQTQYIRYIFYTRAATTKANERETEETKATSKHAERQQTITLKYNKQGNTNHTGLGLTAGPKVIRMV